MKSRIEKSLRIYKGLVVEIRELKEDNNLYIVTNVTSEGYCTCVNLFDENKIVYHYDNVLTPKVFTSLLYENKMVGKPFAVRIKNPFNNVYRYLYAFRHNKSDISKLNQRDEVSFNIMKIGNMWIYILIKPIYSVKYNYNRDEVKITSGRNNYWVQANLIHKEDLGNSVEYIFSYYNTIECEMKQLKHTEIFFG